jgi:hypothetical protein
LKKVKNPLTQKPTTQKPMEKNPNTYNYPKKIDGFLPNTDDMTSPKQQPKIKMPAKMRFLSEKSTETPLTEQTLDYFWMLLIEY